MELTVGIWVSPKIRVGFLGFLNFGFLEMILEGSVNVLYTR
jgi:hypothetical protein